MQGYALEFQRNPPDRPPPPPTALAREQTETLSKEVLALVEKKAVYPISTSTGFFSPIFVVPKKDGGWRPVVNLKGLNNFLRIDHFKMESIASLRDVVQREDYMGRLDLKDAYLSVPISKKCWGYLRFRWGGQNYEFRTLPFGVASAPRVFTKLLRPVAAMMRRRGVRMIIYLDDILILSQKETSLRKDVGLVAQTLTQLGFTINTKKSVFEPSQVLDFLGFTVDTRTMVLQLLEEKVQKTTKACRHMLNQSWTSPRKLAHLIGLLTSVQPAVLHAPLHYRALQRSRNRALRNNLDYDRPCQLLPQSRQDLQCWIHSLYRSNGRKILVPNHQLMVTSDASLKGWGATCRGTSTGGMSSREERQLHINLLELKAAFLGLQVFAAQRNSIHILLRIDNTTAIAYLNKRGGTHSQQLSDLAIQVLEWCISRNITLRAEHIPGRENEEADKESRRGADPSDWMIQPAIFQEINMRWGPLDVDLFAARHNAQLHRFFSYRLDPMAEAVDALNQRWTRMTPYAFPPFILMGRVLRKIQTDRVRYAVVIAPVWPNQHWYPLLLETMADFPVLLPQTPDLLESPTGDPHPLMEQGRLLLAAWKVSGQASILEDFQRQLLTSSHPRGDQERKRHTVVPGDSGVAGVRRETRVYFRHL